MTALESPETELAKLMFDAYNEHGPNPWKTFDGRDVPPWEALNDQVRGKWTAAATEAIKAIEAVRTFAGYAREAQQ